MLRFSIRELMAFVLAAAMGAAWLAEHRQLRAAVAREDEASQQLRAEKAYRKDLDDQIEQMDKELGEHGLRIGWTCGHGWVCASVCKMAADQPAENLKSN